MLDTDYMGGLEYRPGGWEDVDMQLRFIEHRLKYQTTNYYGFGKYVALGKKSIANPPEKVLHRAYHLYGLHGDNLKFDIKDYGLRTDADLSAFDPDYLKTTEDGRHIVFLPWPHIVLPVPKEGYLKPPYKYRTDTYEHWYEDLKKDITEYPDNFGKYGIPHMKGVSHKTVAAPVDEEIEED
jgi:hypothetical protein